MENVVYIGCTAIHASLMEGLGIPVIKALGGGTGLILPDMPVYRELVGSMATFAAPGAVEAWKEALLQPVTVEPVPLFDWQYYPDARAPCHLRHVWRLV